jgi:hypothetical protein
LVPLARVLLWGALCIPGGASAQHMFKCGSGYQDRPCADEEVQQRYSQASGSFSVQQVNADTDKDCADLGTALIPFWKRMNGGENLETLKAEIDGRPISRYEKSRMRDVLLELKQFKGTAAEVRGELERLCMNYKRSKGLPSESEANRVARARSDRAAAAQARSEATRLRAEEARVAAQEQARQRAEQARAWAAQAAAARAAARQAREQQ